MKILSTLSTLKRLGPRTWCGEVEQFGLSVVRELRHISLENAQERCHELSSCEMKGLTVPYAVCEEEGHLFVVRPWVEGSPLEPVIKAETVCQILELLASAPSEFIIYDLRPEHLIQQGNKIILCDPGFEERGHSPYCAPEQVNRGEINPGVVDYQLGATLYHLLSGSPPPDAQTLLIPDVELEPLADLSKKINRHISKLFDPDPMARPLPSDLLADFRDWAKRVKQEEKQLKKKQKKRRWPSSEQKAVAVESPPPKTKTTVELAIESEYADDADPVGAVLAKKAGSVQKALSSIDWSIVAMVALPLLGTLCVGGLLFYSGIIGNEPPNGDVSIVSARPTPTLDNLPQSWVSPQDNAPMILIPAGSYYSGPVPAAGKAARPLAVELPAFYIDRYEVTNRQFKKFVKATGYKAQGNWEEAATDDRLDHPVIRVSFYDCEAYAHWAGKRLPTADEWEKAARGGDLRLYPWGGTEPDYTKFNCVESGLSNTAPVGSFPKGASPYGVEDMAGNVWEWVDTWFIPYGSTEDYTPLTKVIKGGSRSDSAADCMLIQEHGVLPEQGRLANSGFRCVFDPLPGTHAGAAKTNRPSSSAKPKTKKLRSLEQLTPKPQPAKPIEEQVSEVPFEYGNGEGDYDPAFDGQYNYPDNGYGQDIVGETYEDSTPSAGHELSAPDSAAANNEGHNVDKKANNEEAGFVNRTESGEIIPTAPGHTSQKSAPVIPDFSKNSSSGYVDEDQVNYY